MFKTVRALGELVITRIVEFADRDNMVVEKLFDDDIVTVAAMQNPWTRRRRIELAELVNEPWTWHSSGSVFSTLVAEAFRASRLKVPRATVYTDATNVRIRLVVDKGFLTFVPASFLKFPAKHAALRKLPVDLPTPHRQIGIFTLKNRTLSPLAQLLIKCAREVAKPLAKGL